MSCRGRHLTNQGKLRIIELRDAGFNPTKTVTKMKSEGVQGLTRKTVYRILKKWDDHETIGNLPDPLKERKNVTHDVCDFIDMEMEKNDELSAKELTRLVNDRFSVTFSQSKVKDLRRKLGWLCTKTQYCQLVREANRQKRLSYALKCLEDNEQFDDVIWSDECNVQLDWNGMITFHRWWEPVHQKGKPKHPFKVSVWAGISKQGASKLKVFTGIMERTFFCKNIIEDTLVPFVRQKFPNGHRFMQDNDPKHTSNLAKETMEKENIIWWKTPPESPDLNPIENLWHELKNHLRSKVKPRNEKELLAGLGDFWSTVSQM